MRAQGTIQVDLDDFWVLRQRRGGNADIPESSVFEPAVHEYLGLFDKYGIKATFFVTGKDARGRKEIIKEIADKGHEVGNHTMNHKAGFGRLSRQEKEAEIAGAEDAIRDIVRDCPVGFRCPNFDIDSETIDILRGKGYLYDSSLLPTFFAAALRKMGRFLDKRVLPDSGYLGRMNYGFAPCRPFHPDPLKIWKEGRNDIWEFPVTTIPLVRLPFHGSFSIFAYAAGFKSCFFRAGLLLNGLSGAPLNYLFHLCELAPPVAGNNQAGLFEFRLSYPARQGLVDFMLKKITQRYEIVPTRKLILSLCGQQR